MNNRFGRSSEQSGDVVGRLSVNDHHRGRHLVLPERRQTREQSPGCPDGRVLGMRWLEGSTDVAGGFGRAFDQCRAVVVIDREPSNHVAARKVIDREPSYHGDVPGVIDRLLSYGL